MDFKIITYILVGVIALLVITITIISRRNKKLLLQQETDQITLQETQAALEQTQLDASQAKDVFLANISHETLTPMNAIIGLSHVLLQSSLNETQKRDIEKINHSAEKLLAVTNDMLDISQLKADKLTIETDIVDMATFIAGIKQQLDAQAIQKGLDLIFDTAIDLPFSFRADALHLSQVMVNLLNNAIKFTKEGYVALEITSDETHLHFKVSDSGIGLKKEQLSTLFTDFNQADNKANRAYEGSGLGLIISKELVSRMGGDLTIESVYRQGSTFSFSLPLVDATVFDQLQLETFKTAFEKKKILIFESKPKSSDFIERTLTSLDIYVKVVKTEMELQALLNEQHYDVLFLNLRILRVLQKPDILTTRCNYIISLENEPSEQTNQVIRIDARLIKPFSSLLLLQSLYDVLTQVTQEEDEVTTTCTINDIRALSGANILLAEDNEGNAMVVEGLLNGSGINLTVVPDGQKAVEAVIANPQTYDLILMDINMPIMDGYAATSMIREYPHLAHIPIVAMTANITKSDVSKSKKIGMQEHLNKPVDTHKFYYTLKHFIHAKTDTSGTTAPDVKGEGNLYDLSSLVRLGIDIEDGLLRLNGNEEIYFSILKKFAHMFIDFEKEFARAFATKDYDKGRELAHNLKGVAGNIGAKEVFRLAMNLEESFKEQGNDFALHYENLTPVLRPMLQGIDLLKELKPQQAPVLSTQELVALLRTIYVAAKSRKIVEIKNAYQSLEYYDWPEIYHPYSKILHDSVKGYKFDETRKAIEEIMKTIKTNYGATT